MKRFKTILARLTLVLAAMLLAAMDSGVPVLAAPDPEGPPDLHYYTQNGIYFYEDGYLHCGSGASVTGGAAAILEAQTNLDRQWIPLILTEASAAEADPIAMASLLFWEHRGFPEYGAGPAPGESDSVGRGPWQITKATWRPAYGDYNTAVYDPVASTKLAAVLVKEWGGVAGSPIGSIDQDFSKNKNLPSMATLAKNYNAGKYTWREPAIATYKQPGRTWLAPDKNWNNVPVGNITKADVIDDYILGMTFAYYTMATKTGQLTDINTNEFVQTALANADKIKNFKFGDGGTQSGSNVANPCGSSVANGSIVDTAFYLAWPNRNYNNHDAKSYAKESYQTVMPQVQGQGTANSVYEGKTAWTDCGVFVATTIRYSGADPDYQIRGTALQLPYLRRNSDPNDPNRKFDLYENPSKDDLGVLIQPGDIFIVSGRGDRGRMVGHTYIYTGAYEGDDNKDYDSLSASWGKRVPMAANAYFVQDGVQYVVAHVRKPSTPTPPPGVGDQP